MFNGFLYVGETTAMLSYPDQNDRGLYLGMQASPYALETSSRLMVRHLVRNEKHR
jgi:hypothetical protein